MRRSEEFTSFVDARYPSMLRTAMLLTGNRHTAEDLLQEALLRTYATWSRLEVLGAAESYTRTTMVRLLLRDRRRKWSGEVPTEQLPETAPGRSGQGLGDPGHDDRVATVVTVRNALRALPRDQRVVLVLRYYEDLSEAEVARVLGCRPGTVKSRASRAMARLRETGLLPEPAAGLVDDADPADGSPHRREAL